MSHAERPKGMRGGIYTAGYYAWEIELGSVALGFVYYFIIDIELSTERVSAAPPRSHDLKK
eukprot:scaffold360369_cov15-Prasinocladus_malaysianus.AAC.1